MHYVAKLWNKAKNQLDLWFFYGFLFTFTLTIRKVLLFYPIQKKFNEYSGIYLYLSDIFIVFTLIFWIFSILCNKYINLSKKDSCQLFFIDTIKKTFYKWYLVIPLFLVALSFLSTAWAQNHPIALFRSIKFLELYLLYTYIIHRMSTYIKRGGHNHFLKDLCKIIIIIGVFQSIIAIYQFIFQHSLGIFWLRESLISPSIPGVAKIIFAGENIIRAYGLFPHPNMLGGFLLFSIVLTYYYRKLFHVEQFKQVTSPNCSTWNNLSKLRAQIVPRGTIWHVILAIQVVALFLTFSKSAIIALLLAFLYIKIQSIRYKTIKIVPRGTIFKIIGASSLIVLFLLNVFTKLDTSSFLLKSLNERIEYLIVSRGTISDNPITGLGFGQFVLSMQKYASSQLQIWQFQPVHNVFLLIWSELGLVGLGLFFVFMWKLFHVEQFKQVTNQNCSTWNNLSKLQTKIVPRGTILPSQYQKYILNPIFKAIFIGYLFIMFLDHYLWDIHQGQIILWITLGLLIGTSQKKN